MKNIIRETDSHNAALKFKETREAKRRLKGLQIVPSSADSSLGHSSSRYGQKERADKHDRKRRRVESEGDDDRVNGTHRKHSSHRRENETREEREERRKSSYRRDYRSDSDSNSDRVSRHRQKLRSRRTHRSRSRSPHRSSRRERSDRHRHYRHSDSSSSDRDRDRDRGHHRSRRKTHRSYSRSPDRINRSKDKPNITKKAASPVVPKCTEADEIDSDPLEAIVGPAPPPPAPIIRARGRGTFASSSAMDTHFSSTYDPSVDIHPNSDSENDWDQALEALRDRQRWKKQGAERLRSAGFTEEEVTKWEKGGEKTEEDVKWRGMGEGREWDRGKVVDESGMIDRKPEWGRLKGT